jgi:hypothetical protein
VHNDYHEKKKINKGGRVGFKFNDAPPSSMMDLVASQKVKKMEG